MGVLGHIRRQLIADQVPVGYRKNGSRRLVRDEPAASAVAEAFRRRALGASWAELADFLETSGVSGASGNTRWSKPEVAALIRNPVYLGQVLRGAVVEEEAHEPIVSRTEFAAAQASRIVPSACPPEPADANVRAFEGAGIDARSMLYDHRHFLTALVREVRRTNRARRRQPELQLALLSLDGDDFRRINAVHGLRVGDEVLAEIGARIRRALPRGTDLAAHSRGDEFVVLLPDAGLEDAGRTAADLLLAMGSRIGPVERLTFSGGIAALGADEPANDFYARAVQARRRAKRLGKNRIEVAE